MAKPRPLELHVNSSGKKHLKFQEIIHSQDQYVFFPMDGRTKTDVFNRGFLDGRKKTLQVKDLFWDCENALCVLAIPKAIIEPHLSPVGSFSGLITLDRLFLINAREADRFMQDYCMNCEALGSQSCFREIDYDCAEEDRVRFKDTPWFENVKELRKRRKQNRAFPV